MTLSFAEEKLKIGILVPLTGNNKELGQSIIKATKMALKDINNSKLEVIQKIQALIQTKLYNQHLN